ncbi:hypothetical protein HAX54_025821 [Datura stramonium]|uniref:Uncharacterized protein n=1 Tax=Datura stramonium TaxID=4076 RepID=A0ABS8V049_DATST|nr:hypothetical protein [Datura stramonium]
MRVSFSGAGEEDKGGSKMINRDRGIPLRKTRMSKALLNFSSIIEKFPRETKRTVSWLERQFTTQANRDYDSSNVVGYPTAVAAAAFVVKSIEGKSNRDQTRTNNGANKPLNKIKSKEDDTIGRSEKSTSKSKA